MNNKDFDIYNIYLPGHAQHIADIIKTLQPSPNTYIAGDFNAHHGWWYGEFAVRFNNQIKNDKTHSNTIADWMTKEGMTLGNTEGVFIHFFKNYPD